MSNTPSGLRDRLFNTLDGVIAGTVNKEQVEAVCHISQEILKSASVELDYQNVAMKHKELDHRMKQESIVLLEAVIDA